VDVVNEKDRSLHALALKRFDQAAAAEKKERDKSQEDHRFSNGDQWPEAVQRQRQAQDRPCLTINRLPQYIRQVIGDARQNKPAIKVHPVDSGADVETAEMIEGLIRNIEAQSHAPSVYISGLRHAVTGAMGYWRIITEYTTDDSFEQDIRIKRIVDPFSVFFDPGATEYTKHDAKWCFVSEWVTEEDFEARYPKHTPSDWKRDFSTDCQEQWANEDRVRIVEYWVKKPVTKYLGIVGTQVFELGARPDEGAFDRVREVQGHEVCRYVLSGHAVLEGAKEFPSSYIPIIPVYGPEEWHDGQIQHASLIRYAKDPQRMYNFWKTATAEKIALAPKSPYIATPKNVAGHEDRWNTANKSNDSVLLFNPDSDMPGFVPKREHPAPVNAAELQEAAQAVDDMKATMGMYDASLGAKGNETSGRAIIARQREGDTATFDWIDNLAWSIQHTGKILLDMIPRIYDTERVVRVLGEDEAADLIQVNGGQEPIYDMTTGK
jgi:hypothetical protein